MQRVAGQLREVKATRHPVAVDFTADEAFNQLTRDVPSGYKFQLVRELHSASMWKHLEGLPNLVRLYMCVVRRRLECSEHMSNVRRWIMRHMKHRWTYAETSRSFEALLHQYRTVDPEEAARALELFQKVKKAWNSWHKDAGGVFEIEYGADREEAPSKLVMLLDRETPLNYLVKCGNVYVARCQHVRQS